MNYALANYGLRPYMTSTNRAHPTILRKMAREIGCHDGWKLVASRIENRHTAKISAATLTAACRARLIEFLLRRQTVSATSFSIGMTQQALAEELGTVREVVVRESFG
jgi:hypothetical protein